MPASEHAGAYCGLCLSGKGPISFSVMRCAWQYPANHLISQFKYQGKLHYGKVLTALLAAQIRRAYQHRALPDLLVPVPLHPAKLRARGYNQALLISRQLGREFGIPCARDLVQRTRNTPAQQGLRAARRRLNLKAAFALNPARSRQLTNITTLALVDDVVTTMTTANTVASILRKQLPASVEIHLWALARA